MKPYIIIAQNKKVRFLILLFDFDFGGSLYNFESFEKSKATSWGKCVGNTYLLFRAFKNAKPLLNLFF